MGYVNAPVHDLLIRIKNAYMARKSLIEGVLYSKFKVEIIKLLKQYKFVEDYEIVGDGSKKTIKIKLKPVKNPIDDIPNVKFFSKPSRPWYISYKDINFVASGKGIGILSTNKGLMPAHIAKNKKLGGELIAEIY